MSASTINQKSMPIYLTLILIFLVFFSLSSVIPLSHERYAAIDYQLSTSIKEQLEVQSLGHVESINTNVIGPYTSIKIKYFKNNKEQISASGWQLFWFDPVITCISSNPKNICQ